MKPGKGDTVIGPMKVTGTPEAPRRMMLPKVFVDPLFKNVNTPVALVPGMEVPVAGTVLDPFTDVAVRERRATSCLFGSGAPATAEISKVFPSSKLFGVIVTVEV